MHGNAYSKLYYHFVLPKKSNVSADLVELWSAESKVPAGEMTINLITSSDQQGKRYTIMANLLLPSLWSPSEISSLQLGLAKALTDYFDVATEEVFVATRIVQSGRVVEEGKEIKW